MNYANIQNVFQRSFPNFNVSVVGRDDTVVKVGNSCWIGNSVIILLSASIGDGAVIDAGSVVTKKYRSL